MDHHTPLSSIWTYSDDELISTAQLASGLQIDRRTADNWRSLRKGPKYYSLGNGLVRYRMADVRSWLQEMSRG